MTKKVVESDNNDLIKLKKKKKKSKEKGIEMKDGQKNKDKRKKKKVLIEEANAVNDSEHTESQIALNEMDRDNISDNEKGEFDNLNNTNEDDMDNERIYNEASEMQEEDIDDDNPAEEPEEGEENTEETPEVAKFQTSLQKERLEKRKQKRKAKREKMKVNFVDEDNPADEPGEEEANTEDTPQVAKFQTSLQKERLEKRKQKRKAKREKLKVNFVDEDKPLEELEEGEENTEDTPEVAKFQTSLQKERLEKRKQKRKAKREKLKALVKKKAEPKTSKNTKTEGLLWKKFKEVAKDSEGGLESDIEEAEPEKIVCENIEDEPDPLKKAIRLKKSEKRKKKKMEKWLKQKMYKEKAGTAGPSAIRYLHYWEMNREKWRFMKVRHVWLMKNMFNCEMIDNDDFDLLIRYLEPSNEKTKNSLVQEAEEIIANIENEVAEKDEEEKGIVPTQFTDVMDRARQVIQTLAV